MTPQHVLLAAADLIEQPGCWTQGSYARLADGTPIGVSLDPNAASWCAYGAITKVRGLAGTKEAEKARRLLLRRTGASSIEHWNDEDGRTASEVAAKMREAASLTKSGAA